MKPMIVALDVETDRQALDLVRALRSQVDLFKVGPFLFLKYGGSLLSAIQALGAQVFLDMKFHDIPSVVAKAIARAGEWGVYSATVHASGGAAMLKEAAAVAMRPKLWGVTVLTSFDKKDLSGIGVARTVKAQVEALAKLASASGLDGVIASAEEARAIKKACGKAFQVVTPGIRMGKTSDDQKRAHTPLEAMKNGADFFVVGRPVIESAAPADTVRMFYDSIGKVK